jgi:hypothetical protein
MSSVSTVPGKRISFTPKREVRPSLRHFHETQTAYRLLWTLPMSNFIQIRRKCIKEEQTFIL